MHISQLLSIQGLLLNLYGTLALFSEIVFDMYGLNRAIYTPIRYPKKTIYKKMEKVERGYKDVSLTKKEKRLILWFTIICIGVALQIRSNFF